MEASMKNYTDSDFANPTASCDVIMKGGITSGVVYPLALVELARHFRLAHVGGTSAGAIAAAAAAAAEYGRNKPGKGFMRLVELPNELGQILLSLFQPTPALRPVFDIGVACLGNASLASKAAKVILAIIRGFFWYAAAGALPGLLIAVAGFFFHDIAVEILGLLVMLIGIIVAVGLALYCAITRGIPGNEFGLCPGKSQPGNAKPGLTDWLADLIDDIAGRDIKGPPLTFGDLEPADAPDGDPKKITLRMMTTNLTMKRPYSLPFNTGIYAFRMSDFEKLFPKRITDFLATCDRAKNPGAYDDLYMLPTDKLPLVVAARMSLSFPVLFCAVPLYAVDHTLQGDEGTKWRKNVFSDGGLSSNFPIHFFDRMLPNSPTFAISLDDFDKRRVPKDLAELAERDPNDPNVRVWLPKTDHAGSGLLIPTSPINGVFGFVSRIIDAAKDWQDSLQSTLPGYRDRIVHVYLEPDEGGLNLAMPRDLVVRLGAYGAKAGEDLRTQFNLSEHRWRRFLVAVDDLNQTLAHFTEAYNGQAGQDSYQNFLQQYPAQAIAYKEAAAADVQTLRQRAATLAQVGQAWAALPPIPDNHMPHPKSDIRISPRP
jgi:hypothetical protein